MVAAATLAELLAGGAAQAAGPDPEDGAVSAPAPRPVAAAMAVPAAPPADPATDGPGGHGGTTLAVRVPAGVLARAVWRRAQEREAAAEVRERRASRPEGDVISIEIDWHAPSATP
jgi:hypothetical protein